MCFEIDDEAIEELALGRAFGTKEERHLEGCPVCQERVRLCREWIAALRQALYEQRRWEKRRRRSLAQTQMTRRAKVGFSQPACHPIKHKVT